MGGERWRNKICDKGQKRLNALINLSLNLFFHKKSVNGNKSLEDMYYVLKLRDKPFYQERTV